MKRSLVTIACVLGMAAVGYAQRTPAPSGKGHTALGSAHTPVPSAPAPHHEAGS